jgi:hypothetical protein
VDRDGGGRRHSALELTGPEASALASAVGARVPFLPVNVFVSSASLYDLYYALVDIRANLDGAHMDRSIDLAVSIYDGTARRADSSALPRQTCWRPVCRCPPPRRETIGSCKS